MQNIHNRTRRLVERRKERDTKAERAARRDRQQRLFKQRQREAQL